VYTDIISTTNQRTTQQTSKKKRTSKTKTGVITEIRKNEEINSPMNIDYKKQDKYRITTKRYIFISISVLILLFATFGTLIIFYLNRRKFIVIRNSDASSNDTNTIKK
jgi:hypothetical protein